MGFRGASFSERELLEETAWMRRLARALVRDPERAEDLVQDAWVAALESPGGGGGPAQRRPSRSWLAAVLRNRASDERRGRGRRADRERRAARAEGLPAADEALQRVELQQHLARAVFALDEPYRRVIALRYFQGWPPRRIARVLELEARTVEGRLRRGLEHLRRRLDDQHDGKREEWLGGMAVLGLGGAKPLAPLVTGVGLLVLASGAVLAARLARAQGQDSAPRAAALAPESLQGPAPVAARGGAGPARPEPGGRAAPVETSGRARVAFVRAGDELPLADTPVAVGRESLATDGEGVLELAWPDEARSLALRIAATPTTRELDAFLDAPGEHLVRVPRRGGRLEGQVVDLARRPVAGAELRLFDHLGFGRSVEWESPARTARADGEGRFSVGDLADPRGRNAYWKVLASAPGQFSTYALGGQLDGDASARVLLVTEPVRWVPGRVSAWDRPRVAGIELLAWQPDYEVFARAEELFERWCDEGPPSEGRGRPPWDRPERSSAVVLRTDDDGEFRMPVAASGWRLQVDCGDYPMWIEQVEAGTRLVEVHLEGGLALAGLVLDEHGRAVPGADVALYCLETREYTRTDAGGRFRFEALSPLEGAWVAVSAEGHGCAVAAVDLAGREASVVVELERERVVSGRLVDAEGLPVAGRELLLRGDRILATHWQPRHRGKTWEQFAPGAGTLWRTRTDSQGRFEVRRLYPGRFRIRADDFETGVTWAEVPAEGVEFVVVEGSTEGAATLRGSVSTAAGGDPGPFSVLAQPFIEGEDQPAWHQVGGTFAGGRFELTGLDPGRWQLEVGTLDGSASHVGEVRYLRPGEHVVDVVLEPRR